MFGFGQMIGPFIGSLLYELGDFYLPFAFCGVTLIITGILSCFISYEQAGATNSNSSKVAHDNSLEKCTYYKLIKIPGVFYSCLVMIVVALTEAWYLPTLQVIN